MDNPGLTEQQAVSNPNTPRTDRQVFLSQPLPADLHVSGTPTVTLRIRATKPDTELTARLVDYGTATRDNYLAGDLSGIHNLGTRSCWGDSTGADSACYLDTAETLVTSDHGIVSRGWLDAAHHQSLGEQTPLTPGQWYPITWKLAPQDQILAKGHTLGLVLNLSDQGGAPGSTGATVTVDLAGSGLTLPVVGDWSPRSPQAAPRPAVPDPAGADPRARA